MNETKATKMSQFEKALEQFEMANKSGHLTDPLVRWYWQHGLSPIGNGGHAAKAQGILQNILTGPSILAGFALPPEPPEPDADPRSLILIGQRKSIKRMTGILRSHLTTHLLIQGPTGSGKTNLIWLIVKQLIDTGILVIFHDHKNEGRKLLRRYPGVVVLRISDFRENFLKPVGDPKQYFTTFWSEFARAYRIRRETSVKLVAISMRVFSGLKPDEPNPSLYDFACMLHKLSKNEGDATLSTAAMALESLIATMGEAATVREGPCADDLFRAVVIQCHGLPSEFLQFFMGIRLFRSHVRSISHGHSSELTTAIVSDEGGIEFGKEFSAEAGSGHMSPQKRLITQFRSSGTALVIAAQDVSAIDPAVIANVGSFVCLKAQSDSAVRVSARLLGLPEKRMGEVRNIPRWSALFKSPSHPEAVTLEIPEVNMGDYMSDDELERLNRPAIDQLNAKAVFSPIHQDAEKPLSYRDILGETKSPAPTDTSSYLNFDIREEHRLFVKEILSHPTASVVEHYSNLGWSAGRGTRVKGELIENAILESQRQTSRNGRPMEILVITEKGQSFFNENTKS